MFLKMVAVTALSIGMAGAAMAQQAGSGAGNSGANTGGVSTGTGGAANTNTGGASTGNGGIDSGMTGSTTPGGPNGGGKSQDCNAMKTDKNTTGMKQDDASNPASTADCQ